ncbi:MAG: heptose kinase [Deltaproteobacteria bacterium]|nr:heptose kinase [Deltaproteobacteria bacterium]
MAWFARTTAQKPFLEIHDGTRLRRLTFEDLYNMDVTAIAVRPCRGIMGRAQIGSETLYIKRFKAPGKKFFRFLVKSKARKEYENQLFFRKLAINIPEILFFQEQGLIRRRAVLVTREIPQTVTLLEALAQPSGSRSLVQGTLKNLAGIVRRLHDNGFVHNDLRLRNVLIQGERLFLIDCPNGMKLGHVPFFFRRRKIKDLALLYEDAKGVLSGTQMVRFYLLYTGKGKLDRKDKETIRAIRSYYG